jgi:hypothetical protein
MPYANFEKSAKFLDYRRLGTQRVEGRYIACFLAAVLRGGVKSSCCQNVVESRGCLGNLS